jgi:hypothetical protein
VRIATEQVRDKHDLVIVQEKLDGSCVGVYRIGDELHALGRAGYLAQTSPFEQHWLFAAWVRENADRFLGTLADGERLVGEWLAQAHGTRYLLHHSGWSDQSHMPFVAFDLMVGHERCPFDVFVQRVGTHFPIPMLLHRGGAISVEAALKMLGTYGYHGALDPVEGAVWRVERETKGVWAVNYLVKYVKPGKVDGHYLPEVSGGEPVWNWRP